MEKEADRTFIAAVKAAFLGVTVRTTDDGRHYVSIRNIARAEVLTGIVTSSNVDETIEQLRDHFAEVLLGVDLPAMRRAATKTDEMGKWKAIGPWSDHKPTPALTPDGVPWPEYRVAAIQELAGVPWPDKARVEASIAAMAAATIADEWVARTWVAFCFDCSNSREYVGLYERYPCPTCTGAM